MTQREKLIEILSRYFQIGDSYAYNLTRDKKAFAVGTMSLEDFEEFDDFTVVDIVDNILENGVVVPPCKVGQTVYVVNTMFVSEYKIIEMAWDNIFFRFYCINEEYAIECRSFMFFDERIGKTVFLSREEAEKALAERSKE